MEAIRLSEVRCVACLSHEWIVWKISGNACKGELNGSKLFCKRWGNTTSLKNGGFSKIIALHHPEYDFQLSSLWIGNDWPCTGTFAEASRPSYSAINWLHKLWQRLLVTCWPRFWPQYANWVILACADRVWRAIDSVGSFLRGNGPFGCYGLWCLWLQSSIWVSWVESRVWACVGAWYFAMDLLGTFQLVQSDCYQLGMQCWWGGEGHTPAKTPEKFGQAPLIGTLVGRPCDIYMAPEFQVPVEEFRKRDRAVGGRRRYVLSLLQCELLESFIWGVGEEDNIFWCWFTRSCTRRHGLMYKGSSKVSSAKSAFPRSWVQKAEAHEHYIRKWSSCSNRSWSTLSLLIAKPLCRGQCISIANGFGKRGFGIAGFELLGQTKNSSHKIDRLSKADTSKNVFIWISLTSFACGKCFHPVVMKCHSGCRFYCRSSIDHTPPAAVRNNYPGNNKVRHIAGSIFRLLNSLGGESNMLFFEKPPPKPCLEPPQIGMARLPKTPVGLEKCIGAENERTIRQE